MEIDRHIQLLCLLKDRPEELIVIESSMQMIIQKSTKKLVLFDTPLKLLGCCFSFIAVSIIPRKNLW